MDTFPAAILDIINGIIIGETLPGPFSTIFSWASSTVARLPTPDPIITPTRNTSSCSISIAASSFASNAAATAYCENNSILLAAFASIRSLALKSFTSAASCALYPSASNLVIGPIPVLPVRTPVQNSSTVFPIGVTAPSPVTTTRLFILFSFST